MQLLMRSSKQVELTPARSAFLEETRQILARVDRAGSIATPVATGLRGRLDIGMAGSLVYREVPAIIEAFGRSALGIGTVLREQSTADQL
nr:hypothetical protein [Variovorax paradoxus]